MVQQPELRYYPSVVKLLIYLGGSLAFVVGFLMLSGAFGRHGGLDLFGAYLAIGLFGLGTLLFLGQLMQRLLRRPTLVIADAGIIFHAFWRTFKVHWDGVSDIAIYKQTGIYGTKAYWLAVNLRDPRNLPQGRLWSMSRRLNPKLARAAILVPLNQLFVRCTAAKRDALLRDILTHFNPQLSHYGIVVDGRQRSVN